MSFAIAVQRKASQVISLRREEFQGFWGSPYLDRQKDEKMEDRDRKNKSFLFIYLSISLIIIYATFFPQFLLVISILTSASVIMKFPKM